MSRGIEGRFYFKLTKNGNLVGEFSNRQTNGVFTESGDVTQASSGFFGKYISTWQENGKAISANLVITKPNRKSKKYRLVWRLNDGGSFDGEGILCDDILIGDYRSGK